MKAQELILRCYATLDKETQQWVAFCLDLNLAAQGDTFEEAKRSLEGLIFEYVHDAVEGEDRDYADQLLQRRAPWHEWTRYYYLLAKSRMRRLPSHLARLFHETLPLTPAHR